MGLKRKAGKEETLHTHQQEFSAHFKKQNTKKKIIHSEKL